MNFSPIIRRIILDLTWTYIQDPSHAPKNRKVRQTKSGAWQYDTISHNKGEDAGPLHLTSMPQSISLVDPTYEKFVDTHKSTLENLDELELVTKNYFEKEEALMKELMELEDKMFEQSVGVDDNGELQEKTYSEEQRKQDEEMYNTLKRALQLHRKDHPSQYSEYKESLEKDLDYIDPLFVPDTITDAKIKNQSPSVPNPTILAKELSDFQKGSAIQDTFTHITSSESASLIKENGFSLISISMGRVWGDGVYLSSHGTESLADAIYTRPLRHRGVDPVKLNVAVNVKNPYYYTIKTDYIGEIDTGARVGENVLEGRSKIAYELGKEKEYSDMIETIKHNNTELQLNAEERFPVPKKKYMYTDSGTKVKTNLYKYWQSSVTKYLIENGYIQNPDEVALTSILKNAGYDSLYITDNKGHADVGGTQLIVFDPTNVRVII